MKKFVLLLTVIVLCRITCAQDTVVQYEPQPSNQTLNTADERESLIREQQLVVLKDRIRAQHQRLRIQCSDEGVADKNRARFLKNIYYAYLSVYNHYNINSIDQSAEYFAQLSQFDSMQRHLRDSIVGTDSYPTRIENFKNTLKLKAGKENAEVYKSYCRSYQPPTIAINFTTVEEYYAYVRQHLAVIRIQDRYLECLGWLDRIEANSGSIIAMLGNTGHATPYKNIVANTNFVPVFTTEEGGIQFIDKLREFESIQQEYIKSEKKIRRLEQLADSVYRIGRKYSDLTAAFRLVQQGTDLYPAFRNHEELEVYNRKLNDYKTVASQYLHLVYLRDTIANNENITDHSTKTLRDGQRTLKKFTKWTPDFSTPAEGEAFFNNLKGLLVMQQECVAISDNIITQGIHEKEILALTKNYSYIRRAYNSMMKSYDYKGSIATRENLRIYGDLQRMAVDMQLALIEYIKRNPMELERQMRAEKDVRGYKAIIGVK
ncbi:MAG: hypothetical protein J5526_03960 [Bacteroidales bacterium]|nr:hypothetical protein [Bacteroidales bacterium]